VQDQHGVAPAVFSDRWIDDARYNPSRHDRCPRR
jgi:hypothetical protein